MSGNVEAARIQREYERRAKDIPAGFYGLDKSANFFAHCQVARRTISLLSHHGLLPLQGRKIADIGCGAGNWLLEFMQWGAKPDDLFGIDLDASRIDEARERIPGATLRAGDASALPLAGGLIDLACQFTAFSSVLDEPMKQAMAAEMLRVLRDDGAILWYDLRVGNPANPAVRGIGMDELRHLFPGCRFDAHRVTLAPPIARAVAPRSWTAASLLEKLPALCSHSLVLIGKVA